MVGPNPIDDSGQSTKAICFPPYNAGNQSHELQILQFVISMFCVTSVLLAL